MRKRDAATLGNVPNRTMLQIFTSSLIAPVFNEKLTSLQTDMQAHTQITQTKKS